MSHTQLVSVVMPSFNQAEFISRAIDSVFEQDYSDVELIVSDGGSTDGTIDILAEKSDAFGRLRWVSEPDNGPADALNKALSRVRGEIVGWLNSDDVYARGAVGRAVSAFDENPHWIMCYGHGEHIDAEDQSLGAYHTQKPDVGLQGFERGCFICQPTMFFKTSLLALIGDLDLRQKTSFDYEYWMRAFRALPDRIGFIDALQAKSRLHDGCITRNQRRAVAVEAVRLGQEYFGAGAQHWITTYLEEVRPEFARGEHADSFGHHVEALLKDVDRCLSDDQITTLRQLFS